MITDPLPDQAGKGELPKPKRDEWPIPLLLSPPPPASSDFYLAVPDQREFPKPRHDRGPIPFVAAPVSYSTLLHPYNVTNIDLTASPQDDGRFDSLPSDRPLPPPPPSTPFPLSPISIPPPATVRSVHRHRISESLSSDYPPLASPETATFHHTGPLGRCPYSCMIVRA